MLIGLRWEDGIVPYNETERLITTSVFEHDAIVYVKGYKKRTCCEICFWMMGENVCIEILDAIYEDMKSLTNMDVTNTMRCGQHIKNYALQMY